MTKYQKAVQGIVSCFAFATLCVDAIPVAAQQSQQQPRQAEISSSQVSGQSDSAQTSEQSDEGKKSTRVFGIMPNNMTIEGAEKITPISAREKFRLVAESAFDPYEFGIAGVLAGIG